MNLSMLARKLHLKKRMTDRTKEFWNIASSRDMNGVMNAICDKYDKDRFKTKKDSIIFSQNVKLDKSMTVLDLACGIGRTCRWVAPFVTQYVGVDFMPEMIAKANQYNENIHNAEFITNNGKDLSGIQSDTFDIIYCDLAFQHMTKSTQQSYVNEVYRVLKNHGMFYVQIPRYVYYENVCDDAWDFSHTAISLEKMFEKFDFKFNKTDAYFLVKAECWK